MRLIDADALAKKLPLAGKRAIGGGNYERIYGGIQIHNTIDNMPTIDAEPVRHGRWVKTKFDEYVCSLCGEEAPNDGFDCGAKYCYECGAKMDGGAE